MPWPSFSPKVRLRDSGDEQVATRSPRPARPIRVSGLAPSAIASRAVSASPRVITEAVVLSPKPSPTAMPTDRADDVLVGAAELAADARRRWCRAGTPASGTSRCSLLRDVLVGAGDDRGGRLAAGDLVGEVGAADHGDPLGTGVGHLGDHLAHPLERAELDALHQRDEHRVGAGRTAPTPRGCARKVCDGTAKTTTSASCQRLLGVVGRRDRRRQLDAGQVVGVLAAPVDRVARPPRGAPTGSRRCRRRRARARTPYPTSRRRARDLRS